MLLDVLLFSEANAQITETGLKPLLQILKQYSIPRANSPVVFALDIQEIISRFPRVNTSYLEAIKLMSNGNRYDSEMEILQFNTILS